MNVRNCVHTWDEPERVCVEIIGMTAFLVYQVNQMGMHK